MIDLKLKYNKSIMEFLTNKEESTLTNIHERMVDVYGDNFLIYFKIKFWWKQFKSNEVENLFMTMT